VQGAGVLMRASEKIALGEVMLGGELAMTLGIAVGDNIKLRSVWNLEGIPYEATVTGIAYPESFDIAKQVVWLPKNSIESLVGFADAVTRIEVELVDPMTSEQIADVFNASVVFAGEWKTWQQQNTALLTSLRLERNMMALAMFFLVLLAALALYLCLSVRVVERRRQSALLMSIGAKPWAVEKIFIIEGLYISVVGTSVGAILAYAFCTLISNSVLLPEIYYSRTIPVAWNWSSVLYMSLMSLAMAVLASWLPAAQVKKVEIAQALRS